MAADRNKIEEFISKMKAENLPQLVIDTFLAYYDTLTIDRTGFIHEEDINPVDPDTLPDYTSLASYSEQGKQALSKAAIIKLNGGLGTSMGLDGPKCMLPVKGDHSFFDIAVHQILNLRKKTEIPIPLILMNSFSTDAKTVELLNSYPELSTGLPLSFLQHKYPKILQEDLTPVHWPDDKSFEWNPPGHGDVYTALATSGLLQQLLEAGITYVFISNIDNLGATMDISLLGYLAAHNLPFMMEVAQRTEMDKKGGHLARLKQNNRLILRERAQADEKEIDQFEDIQKYRYFNSNNVWVNLEHLETVFNNPAKPFQLPLIVNPKHLVPFDDTTPEVFQLETAMGAALSSFPNSQAVIITDKRFRPVKKCDDLLILWSDNFFFTEQFELRQNPERHLPPMTVSLDERYYKKYHDMKLHFPHGAPSLIECKSLTVEGDILFGKDIILRGEVTLKNNSDTQVIIPDGSIIEKDIAF